MLPPADLTGRVLISDMALDSRIPILGSRGARLVLNRICGNRDFYALILIHSSGFIQ